MRTVFRYFLLAAIAAILFAFQPISAQNKDSDVKLKIQDEIARYYRQSINVSMQDPGIVTLKGDVKSYWDKRNIHSIVARVYGVQKIKNEITVQTELVADSFINTQIRGDLDLNGALEDPERIEVVVSNGLVILRGNVNSLRQANLAEDIASWQKGVKSVTSEIRVLPSEEAFSDANLNAILLDMIERLFPRQKEYARVNVMNGKATLTGTVDSLWALQQIEKEVLRIQGITGVDNQLTIKPRKAAMAS